MRIRSRFYKQLLLEERGLVNKTKEPKTKKIKKKTVKHPDAPK